MKVVSLATATTASGWTLLQENSPRLEPSACTPRSGATGPPSPAADAAAGATAARLKHEASAPGDLQAMETQEAAPRPSLTVQTAAPDVAADDEAGSSDEPQPPETPPRSPPRAASQQEPLATSPPAAAGPVEVSSGLVGDSSGVQPPDSSAAAQGLAANLPLAAEDVAEEAQPGQKDGVEQFSIVIRNCRLLGPGLPHTLAAAAGLQQEQVIKELTLQVWIVASLCLN